MDIERSRSFDQLRVLAAVDFPLFCNLRICAESGADETVRLLYGRSDSVDVEPTSMLHVCEVVAPKDVDAVLDVCTTCSNPLPMICRKRDWRGYCYRCHTLKVDADRPTPRPLSDQLLTECTLSSYGRVKNVLVNGYRGSGCAQGSARRSRVRKSPVSPVSRVDKFASDITHSTHEHGPSVG